jgi:endonuclease/exonuclease/phosphatase family metal-dependent hydrolase
MRVMTWNVENLFEPGTGEDPPDQATFDAKLDALETVVRAQSPDVVALQEIGSPEAADALHGRVEDVGYTNPMVSSLPDSRGIRFAFLTKLPVVTGPVDVSAFPADVDPVQVSDSDDPAERMADRMGRGALEITVRAADGLEVTVITAHLKSKLLSFPRPGNLRFTPVDEHQRTRYSTFAVNRRAAEAATVRARVNELLDGHGAERAVVVAGDLNDEPDAATTLLLTGPPGSEIGTPGFTRPDQGDGDRLWNLAPLIEPPERRVTRIYRGRGELIDHILASRRLVDPDAAPLVTTVAAGDLASIDDDPTGRRLQAFPDHAAVIATF